MREASSPNMKSRLTRIGLHFAFVAIFAMIGGSLRGFNLLLVLAGVLVAALILGWRYSKATVSGLTVVRRHPKHVHAGESFQLQYSVRSSNGLTAWMIQIEDSVRDQNASARSSRSILCGLGSVGSTNARGVFVESRFRKRGRYEIGPIQLSSSFPLTLVRSTKTLYADNELWVFPELLQLRKGWQEMLVSQPFGLATKASRQRSMDGEFYGLRPWQSGDSRRWIHWRTTAKTGELSVRQFENSTRHHVTLIIDAVSDSEAPSSQNDRSIDFLARLAATIVQELATDRAHYVSLVTMEDIHSEPRSACVSSKNEMLRRLSVLEANREDDLYGAPDFLKHHPRRTSQLVISNRERSRVLADADDEESKAERSLRESFAEWLSHGQVGWLCSESASVRRWVQSSEANDQHRSANEVAVQ